MGALYIPCPIPTRKVKAYSLAVTIIYSLSSLSIAMQVQDRWLRRWKVFSFWSVYLAVLSVTIILAIFTFDLSPLFQSSLLPFTCSIVLGLFCGGLSVSMDRAIIRKIRRRAIGKGKHKKGFHDRIRNMEVSLSAPSVKYPTEISSQQSIGPNFKDLLIVLSVAVLEEIIYRGVLVQASFMLPSSLSVSIGLILTVIWFALTHLRFGWPHVCSKLPLGGLSLLSVLLFDSIAGAIVTHVWFNVRAWKDMTVDMSELLE